MIRRVLSLLVALSAAGWAQSGPDVHEIVKRSVRAMTRDWNAAPNFTFTERDVESQHDGARTVKTYQVLMIEGSPYNRLVAVNDKPLSGPQEAAEDGKLAQEIQRRQNESREARQRRTSKYRHERQSDHAMMTEMAVAFNFKLLGEETLAGRPTWVLEALPKPGYQPHSRETRVLPGMRGKLWVDKAQYHWTKVEAEVVQPVSFYGFLAKVGPGTKFMLENAPVSATIWQPTRFSVTVRASALGFLNEDSTDDETYTQYRPMPSVAELIKEQ